MGRDAVGNFPRKAVRSARDACTNRLTKDENVRFQIFSSCVAAGPGADSMGFVNKEQRTVLAGQFPQRLVIANGRMHDANIRHRRLRQHASHVSWRQGRFQASNIVELHDLGCH